MSTGGEQEVQLMVSMLLTPIQSSPGIPRDFSMKKILFIILSPIYLTAIFFSWLTITWMDKKTDSTGSGVLFMILFFLYLPFYLLIIGFLQLTYPWYQSLLD